MLCQFTFSNFKSFKNEATLDMQASSQKEQEQTLILNKKERFVRVASIFGPNASGKSNVIEALWTLVKILTRSASWFSAKEDFDAKAPAFRSKPFAFSLTNIESPTIFNIFYRWGGFEFNYRLVLNNGEINGEALFGRKIENKKMQKYFVRNTDNTIELGEKLSGAVQQTYKISSKMPLFSYLKGTFDINDINIAYDWFDKCIVLNMGSNLFEYKNGNQIIDKLLQINNNEESIYKMITDHLRMIDSGIVKIYNQQNNTNDQKLQKNTLLTQHYSDNNELVDLLFVEESSGTRKMFLVIQYVYYVLVSGSVLVVDELDAKLHTKLLRYIIALFKDPTVNIKNAQLIFTSHDIMTMSREVFRRDEIWFVAKDNNGASDLYSLAEFKLDSGEKVRNDATYDKDYLIGRYGADPVFEKANKWEEI